MGTKRYGYKPKALLLRDLMKTYSGSKVELIAEMRRNGFVPFRIAFGQNAGEIAFRRVPQTKPQIFSDTDLELIVEDILTALGYKVRGDYRKQHHTCGYIIDFAFPTIKLAIEPGARYWHGDREHAIDHEKDRILRREGWEILWYDEEDLRDEERVEEEISTKIQELGYIQ